MATPVTKSVLLGFYVCELCSGKTHVKRKEEAGKRPYNHCVDEHELGCSHSTHATNAVQEKLLLQKMRPVAAAPTATPTPEVTETSQAAPVKTIHLHEPTATPAELGHISAPRRRGLFS